jgi:3-vinyl bacteriochlorophyllide hydratase
MHTQNASPRSVASSLPRDARAARSPRAAAAPWTIEAAFDNWIDRIAAVPWQAHGGVSARRRRKARAPLYTPQERERRDRSIWTVVQGVLAPLQFAIFAVSLWLVLTYLATGEGYAAANASVLLKTVALIAIMVTGSIWEKAVFGKWLFAPAFFWEDVFSMAVIALHAAYVMALVFHWGTPDDRMWIAIAAYAAYVVNAAQFLWKLREARLEAKTESNPTQALGRAA